MKKSWYHSKTLWVNIFTVAWHFVGPLVGIPTLDNETLVALLAIVNLVLRVITKQPLSA